MKEETQAKSQEKKQDEYKPEKESLGFHVYKDIQNNHKRSSYRKT